MDRKYMQTMAHGLILMAAMLALIAAALWLGPARFESTAQAKIGLAQGGGIQDAAGQRQQMIAQLQVLNERLASIEQAFRDGTFVVQTVNPEEAAKKAAKGK